MDSVALAKAPLSLSLFFVDHLSLSFPGDDNDVAYNANVHVATAVLMISRDDSTATDREWRSQARDVRFAGLHLRFAEFPALTNTPEIWRGAKEYGYSRARARFLL